MRLGSEDLSGVNKVKPNSSIATGRISESDKMREESLYLVSGMLVGNGVATNKQVVLLSNYTGHVNWQTVLSVMLINMWRTDYL